MRAFKAKMSTDDGRLKKHSIYYGHYIAEINRVVIIDEKREPMTFDPGVFVFL